MQQTLFTPQIPVAVRPFFASKIMYKALSDNFPKLHKSQSNII